MANERELSRQWQPPTGTETALTVLPFVLFSILTTVKTFFYVSGTPDLIFLAWHLGEYLVALLGMGVGWVKGFPRWSLGYLGLALVYSWWLDGFFSHGFELFGYALDGGEWRGWSGLLAVVLVATLISRSLAPLGDLAKSIWIDWSRLSFIFYGALTWLTLGIIYDGLSLADAVAIAMLQVSSASLFILLGVFAYLHVRLPWQRGLALQGAFNLSWLSSIAIDGLVSGETYVDWPILAVWLVFLLLPGIMGIMRWADRWPSLA